MTNLYQVSPEKYNEKNMMESMLTIFAECLPVGVSGQELPTELVSWAKFEAYDGCSEASHSLESSPSLVFSIGTARGLYIWSLPYEGFATLLYSQIGSFINAVKLLPRPSPDQPENFKIVRPLLAICAEASHLLWEVRFVSLVSSEVAATYKTPARVTGIDATADFVVCGQVNGVAVLDNRTLRELFFITNVKPIPRTMPTKSLPLALGHRWLAFPDVKPVYQHLSRCGDASDEDSQSVAATMLNVNKRIWSSLSALASSVSLNNQHISYYPPPMDIPAHLSYSVPQGHPISHPSWRSPLGPAPFIPDAVFTKQLTSLSTSSSSTTPLGYVTIVDLVKLAQRCAKPLPAVPSATEPAIPETLTAQLIDFSQPATAVPSSRPVLHLSSPQLGHGVLSQPAPHIDVHEFSTDGAMVAHFLAHRLAGVGRLAFDSSGSLLFTACTQGHAFHVFRISNHPQDHRQTAIHHLYILERGNTPCEVVDVTFSRDSRWLAVSSNHGTTHVFPLTPYGGPITVRTHTRTHLVNRTSRYHRSSGLEEHHLTKPHPSRSGSAALQQSGDTMKLVNPSESVRQRPMCLSSHLSDAAHLATCPSFSLPMHGDVDERMGGAVLCPSCGMIAESCSCSSMVSPSTFTAAAACTCPLNVAYNTTNARRPPYPEPCRVLAETRLRPRLPAAALGGALEAVGGSSVGGAIISPPPGNGSTGFHMAAQFHPPVCYLPSNPRSSLMRDVFARNTRAVDSLFVVTWDLHLVEFELSVLPADPTSLNNKVYQDGPIKLESTPVGQWNLITNTTCLPPFPPSHPLLLSPHRIDRPFSRPAEKVELPADYSGNLFDDAVGESRSTDSCLAYADKTKLVVKPTESSPSGPLAHSMESSESLSTSHRLTVAPEGWPSDDAASYWYSQVELTTHLGPLRRVWMGPQFTFRTYPNAGEASFSGDTSTLFEHSSADISHSSGVEGALVQLPSRSPTLAKAICGRQLAALDSRHLGRGFGDNSSLYPSLQSGGGFRRRRPSGDSLGTIGINYCSDARILIEGGSYQDSSPGGSMSSLVSKSVDDVAHNIADAMQEDDVARLERHLSGIGFTGTQAMTVPVASICFTGGQLRSDGMCVPPACARPMTGAPVNRPLSATLPLISTFAFSEQDFPALDESNVDAPSSPDRSTIADCGVVSGDSNNITRPPHSLDRLSLNLDSESSLSSAPSKPAFLSEQGEPNDSEQQSQKKDKAAYRKQRRRAAKLRRRQDLDAHSTSAETPALASDIFSPLSEPPEVSTDDSSPLVVDAPNRFALVPEDVAQLSEELNRDEIIHSHNEDSPTETALPTTDFHSHDESSDYEH